MYEGQAEIRKRRLNEVCVNQDKQEIEKNSDG